MQIYESITELPLNRFIDCLVKDNLYALIIEGDAPPIDVLYRTWNDIIIQYNEALGDSETKMYGELRKEVALLKVTLTQIQGYIHVLRSAPYESNEDEAKELNKLTYSKFAFDPVDKEKYYADLLKCERKSAGMLLRLDLKSAALDAMEKKNPTTNQKPNKEWFLHALITLTDHSQVRVNESDITVFEFCERMRRYSIYVDKMQKAEKK